MCVCVVGGVLNISIAGKRVWGEGGREAARQLWLVAVFVCALGEWGETSSGSREEVMVSFSS